MTTTPRGASGNDDDTTLILAAPDGVRPELSAADRPPGAAAPSDRDGPLPADAAAPSSTQKSLEGQRVDAYRIGKLLAKGGMGEVYVAFREDDFEQSVAFKVIQARFATRVNIVERFLREREILAHLNHQHIARLLNGGSLPDRRPYLVMELVEGLPVTEFCDEQRLTIPQRLTLFVKICEAVEYAHRKDIIHRDIKPSNVLVTRDGEPKLLDFGIAKLIAPVASGAMRDLTTDTSLAPASWLSASPEQLRNEEKQSATSDVYSLGVLLYELLTGAKPFSFEQTEGRSRRECLPATLAEVVLSAPATELEARAHVRGTTPDRLVRALRGDLEHVVGMAIRFDPRMRYQTVAALRGDIVRHQHGKRLVATPRRSAWDLTRIAPRWRSVALIPLLAVVALGLLGLSQLSRAGAKRSDQSPAHTTPDVPAQPAAPISPANTGAATSLESAAAADPAVANPVPSTAAPEAVGAAAPSSPIPVPVDDSRGAPLTSGVVPKPPAAEKPFRPAERIGLPSEIDRRCAEIIARQTKGALLSSADSRWLATRCGSAR